MAWYQRLSLRILLPLLGVLLLSSWGSFTYSEKLLERVILEQVQRQAEQFLVGMARQIDHLDTSLDRLQLEQLFHQVLNEKRRQRQFSILKIYLYNHKGEVIAHSEPGEHPPKVLSGKYGDVLRSGNPYHSDTAEQKRHPRSGEWITSVDIIIPLFRGGEIIAALESELDLTATKQTISTIDDEFEAVMVQIVLWSSLLLALVPAAILWLRLIRPVRSLSAVTHQIAQGDLSARVHYQSSDELGVLGAAVNQMASSIELLFEEKERSYLQMVKSLTKALEAKDAYTAGHSGRVAHYSVLLGRRLKLEEKQLMLLRQGALMHDLGKIGIPDRVLNKPEQLTDEEYEQMRAHPVLTATIMRPLRERFREFSDIASWHHERWDGKGYPDGLKGEEVPLLARIVAIADSWDAMTGDRIYRKGMGKHKALSIMCEERDSGQWDPVLILEFIAMIEGALDAEPAAE